MSFVNIFYDKFVTRVEGTQILLNLFDNVNYNFSQSSIQEGIWAGLLYLLTGDYLTPSFEIYLQVHINL